MTDYREILRLQALGINKQETAAIVGCSRNTVAEVLRRAEERGVKYPLPAEMTDAKLAETLYPSASLKPTYKMPDYAYVAKEMMLAALIDRVTFRSYVLNMNCSSSYRFDTTVNS